MPTPPAKQLFQLEENFATLKEFVASLKSTQFSTDFSNDLKSNLLGIVNLIIANPKSFDEQCISNVEWIGSSFISNMRNFIGSHGVDKLAEMSSIFTDAYRFLCELDFSYPEGGSFDVRRIMGFATENLEKFSNRDRSQITFASYVMPAQITKRLINDPAVADFRMYIDSIESARKLKSDWDLDLDKRTSRLVQLDNNLKKFTTEYNFVGLVDGFKNMAKDKMSEKQWAFWSLISIGVLMLGVAMMQVIVIWMCPGYVEAQKEQLIYAIPAIIATEVFLLYFFRVVLAQFRSVKAQLLQLDLRVALCQFIESYADYSKTVKAQDATALAKFESLIFSGLVSEGEGIPSTFDGADQIANLIKSMRGTKG